MRSIYCDKHAWDGIHVIYDGPGECPLCAKETEERSTADLKKLIAQDLEPIRDSIIRSAIEVEEVTDQLEELLDISDISTEELKVCIEPLRRAEGDLYRQDTLLEEVLEEVK